MFKDVLRGEGLASASKLTLVKAGSRVGLVEGSRNELRGLGLLAVLLSACPGTEGETSATSATATDSGVAPFDPSTSVYLQNPTEMGPTTSEGGVTGGTTYTSGVDTGMDPCEGSPPEVGECDDKGFDDPDCHGGFCTICTAECLCPLGNIDNQQTGEPCMACDVENGYIEKEVVQIGSTTRLVCEPRDAFQPSDAYEKWRELMITILTLIKR